MNYPKIDRDPRDLPADRRYLYWRVYWWSRVIGAHHATTAAMRADAVARNYDQQDDIITAEGERMWLREIGAP